MKTTGFHRSAMEPEFQMLKDPSVGKMVRTDARFGAPRQNSEVRREDLIDPVQFIGRFDRKAFNSEWLPID